MKFKNIDLQRCPKKGSIRQFAFQLALLLCLFSSLFYPSSIEADTSSSNAEDSGWLVRHTEDYGRYINTFLQVALPLATRDLTGLKQLMLVAVTGTLATHGMKRALNDVKIMGTRLGQRPSNTNSKHNMPSGHASLAGSGAYFVCRRYGLRFALFVVPILFMTMYTRVILDAHTVSAVLAGSLIGILTAALFTTKYQWPETSRISAVLAMFFSTSRRASTAQTRYKRIF